MKVFVNWLNRDGALYLLLLVWLITGIYAASLSWGVVILSMLLFRHRQYWVSMLIGLLFILVLSDSRLAGLEFAKTLKNGVIVIVAAGTLFGHRDSASDYSIAKFFVPFFIVAGICLINSENVILSFEKTLSYLLLLISIPLLIRYAYHEFGDDFLKILLMFSGILLLAGFVLRIFAHEIVFFEARYRGIFGNPNGLAIYSFLYLVFLSIVIQKRPSIFQRWEKIILFVAPIISLIWSGSRSSIVASLIFLIFSRLQRFSGYVGFILFVVICVLYQLLFSNLIDIITFLNLESYFRLDTIDTGSGRLIAWNFAWAHIQDHFFLGKGFAHTELLFEKYQQHLSMMGHQGNAHNSYLTFWLDTGLVGLVAFLFGLLANFIRLAGQTPLLIPALYAILFSTFFESWLTASLNPFTVFVWMMLSVSQLEMKTETMDPVVEDGRN